MDDKSNRMSLRDANQNFAACVREVEDTGREIVITRRGVPVARIAPLEPEDREARREAAWTRLSAIRNKRLKLGHKGPLDRDSLYDRDR